MKRSEQAAFSMHQEAADDVLDALKVAWFDRLAYLKTKEGQATEDCMLIIQQHDRWGRLIKAFEAALEKPYPGRDHIEVKISQETE